MIKYIVRELQNENSQREGVEIYAHTLRHAKRKANALQLFEGTVLRIESSNSASVRASDVGLHLSVKKGSRWRDVE